MLETKVAFMRAKESMKAASQGRGIGKGIRHIHRPTPTRPTHIVDTLPNMLVLLRRDRHVHRSRILLKILTRARARDGKEVFTLEHDPCQYDL